jgi:hypothetical protein
LLQQQQDQISLEVLMLLRLQELDRMQQDLDLLRLQVLSRLQQPVGVAGLSPSVAPDSTRGREVNAVLQARRLLAANVALPAVLFQPEDHGMLSRHQIFLRQHIEAFQATEDDVNTPARGRNKPIAMKQVGIRCRYCAHLPVARRRRGSTYFPHGRKGLYQAAQNMNSTHLQCGLCREMPNSVKEQFAQYNGFKGHSRDGPRYWAMSAKKLGLIDTDKGIFFIWDLPLGVQITEDIN